MTIIPRCCLEMTLTLTLTLCPVAVFTLLLCTQPADCGSANDQLGHLTGRRRVVSHDTLTLLTSPMKVSHSQLEAVGGPRSHSSSFVQSYPRQYPEQSPMSLPRGESWASSAKEQLRFYSSKRLLPGASANIRDKQIMSDEQLSRSSTDNHLQENPRVERPYHNPSGNQPQQSLPVELPQQNPSEELPYWSLSVNHLQQISPMKRFQQVLLEERPGLNSQARHHPERPQLAAHHPRRRAAGRRKRQTFDFSMNTPAPTPTRASTAPHGESEPGTAQPSPRTTGKDEGLDLGSVLGDLLGSSDDAGTHGAGETAVSEDGDHEGLSGSSNSSTSSPPAHNEEEKPEGGDLDVNALAGSSNSGDGSRTPGTQQGEADDGGGAGDAGSWLDGLFGSSHSTDCGINICPLANPCHNNGKCLYNTTTCAVHCLCPTPYDDRGRYDWYCQELDTTLPASATPSHFSVQSPGPSTSLRPVAERKCGVLQCWHGVCNDTDPIHLICMCDPGWTDIFCDVPCSMNCSNGGVCLLDESTNTQFCNCPKPWTGYNCSELPPPPPEEDMTLIYWLGGSLAVGVVVVVTAGILFMFCLWRKRLVFALKIVYYFLPYEHNDGRQYDAFVSYVLKDEDEQFVYTNLHPTLEKEMGFKLCLHQRDFLPGEVLADNILNALESSRRFILVLSPRYLQSEWAEFEFQRAFHEMLKRKLRIIPVILEDISQCESLNPTLKVILDSVTHIKYPGHDAQEQQLRKFWKKMQLSMPKIKKRDGAHEAEDPEEGQLPGTENGAGTDLTLVVEEAAIPTTTITTTIPNNNNNNNNNVGGYRKSELIWAAEDAAKSTATATSNNSKNNNNVGGHRKTEPILAAEDAVKSTATAVTIPISNNNNVDGNHKFRALTPLADIIAMGEDGVRLTVAPRNNVNGVSTGHNDTAVTTSGVPIANGHHPQPARLLDVVVDTYL